MLPRAVLRIVLLVSASSLAAAADVDFAREVRPILSRSCLGCHGEKKQESGLRLDRRQGAMLGGERGPAIVPGKGDASLLVQVVAGTHAEIRRMPKDRDPLAPEEIATLRRWIDAGAPWAAAAADGDAAATDKRRHWAFRAPVRPPLPAVKDPSWARNAIDLFVLARLDKEGLVPSPEADPTTLVRRLHLDLIGLPPSLDELDELEGAASSGVRFEDEVERLLASPHHGERWGRHWLDAARYADSDGFEKDKPRFVWFYRDWVVRALNRDLPYDEFIVDQLAGDLLPGAGQEQIVATGFLRNSMINEEGGVDPEQFRMEAMFDRMDAIGRSVLGLTIQCAQCHNHKFDPLMQEEYYRIFAYLNNDAEGSVAAYTPDDERRRAEVFREIREVEADLRHRHPDWRERLEAWVEATRGDQPSWTVVRPDVDEISTGGQKYLPLEDGSFLAQSYAPTKHTVLLTARTDLEGIRGFRIELLPDTNLPRGGPGRSLQGTCALTELEVHAAPAGEPAKRRRVELVSATADFEQPEKPLEAVFDDRSKKTRITGPAAYAIDGKDETAWGIDAGPGRSNQPRQAVFVAKEPISHPGGTVLTFHVRQNHGGWNSDDNQSNNLGRFRLSITATAGAAADPLPPRVRAIVEKPREARSPGDEEALFGCFRRTVSEWGEQNERIERAWSRYPEGASQLVLQSRDRPRATAMLLRGDFLKPSRPVTAGTPAFLHPADPATPPTRLGFARWLVDRRSPTTARAIVNRIWQAYFGTGLVATSEDLGTQSEPASHPELLDWLAVEFMDRGWSLKSLHRLIVGSATYRQSSRAAPELLARDPYNRLLARASRLRVEGEVVRDIALAASGLLTRKLGGRSVFPPIPPFLLEPPASYGPKIWPEEAGEDRYRRAFYTFRYRSLPYPMLQTFDAPNGDFSCVRRVRSNTPLQALVALNEPLSVECARALAVRVVREGGAGDAERIAYAFRRCVARPPASDEAVELTALLQRQRARAAAGELAVKELVGDGPEVRSARAAGVPAAELAAWTIAARVILNLDETITRE